MTEREILQRDVSESLSVGAKNLLLKQALQKLVDLKNYKDQYGKDGYYEEHQPKAWEEARKVLRLCEG